MTQDKYKDYRLFGRRQGAALSARQQHLVDTLLPEYRIPLEEDRLATPSLRDMFEGEYTRFHLEIGFGGAEHLIWQARRAPQTGFIGCEPFINGVAKLLSAIEELKLENIRIYDHDARDLLKLLPASSLDKAYVLFPDPWPKKRHKKRRFITQNSLNQLARVMEPGAHLCFASDIPDYISWVEDHVCESSFFEIITLAEPPHRPQTRYEMKAAMAGRASKYLTILCTK